jgi:hypothetical protein
MGDNRMSDIWLENILLEYGNRILDVANNKENPTIGELIDRPKKQILERLDKAIGKNISWTLKERRQFSTNDEHSMMFVMASNTTKEKLRQQLGIKR